MAYRYRTVIISALVVSAMEGLRDMASQHMKDDTAAAALCRDKKRERRHVLLLMLA